MLKRKHARICVLLFVLALAFIALPGVMYEVLDAETAIWGMAGVVGAVTCTGLTLIVRMNCLRCPNCGEGLAIPQWFAGKRYYCSRCGKPFVFDDEKGEGDQGDVQ